MIVLDRLELPVESLPQRLRRDLEEHPEPVLWLSRRPRKYWYRELSDRHPLLLCSAPLYEQILWLPPGQSFAAPASFQAECGRLLEGYPELFRAARPPLDDYLDLLHSHIKHQEKVLYPDILCHLPVERSLRELGYEHRGLERAAQKLPEVVRAWSEGSLSSSQREKFDLYFFHLLEHHLERERDALLPALTAVQWEAKFPQRIPEKG